MNVINEFSMKYPIIQAPMAGVTTAEMVVASLEAGVLGAIGAGYMSANQTREIIRQVKKESTKPFMVNLFAHEVPPIVQHQISIAKQGLIDALNDPFIKKEEINLSASKYDEQLEVVLEEGVAICSFTFGLPTKRQVRLLKDQGMIVFATATSVAEINAIIELELDGIILQGEEAGGHRGSFIDPIEYNPLSTIFKEAKKRTELPLIVAGGISTKAQMDYFMNEGASAIMMGTLFLVSDESGAPSAHKQAILNAESNTTVVTTSFSGKPARGVANEFIEKMLMMPVAPFPYQNDLTQGIRSRAKLNNDGEYMSLWAGTSLYNAKSGTINEIVEKFMQE
ncbi:nitronate monooxygenase [Kurthia zopfii]|uniref:Probable nitronate monooxygenase n=1 Tax=Kurthia zopfii TaxID=1650 RepID=A0A8B4Q9B1_9BACL|nr:nitronate monooxygenase [Kurthia zopfii]PWI23428.1 2-nitropropane dioxygenase [Kurthia zopfii]TDR39836.1 nitronate monooxygenase [Kurthia zopfii]GEK30724.1 nitronate monooxygenase [Kurthia zopfii]STX09285.1 Nitronate monooxygenase [Kurthia zopfii]